MSSEAPAFAPFEAEVDAGTRVAARHYPTSPAGRLGTTVVLAHGAGAGQASRFMVAFALGLARRGLDAVTFDFPYIQAHRRIPDANARLEVTWRAVLAAAAAQEPLNGSRWIIGGKSMGGRIASQVAAQPDSLPIPLAGLVFLGYPLHPPGRPEQRRDAHLPRITCPMLFIQGERDSFGDASEMSELVEGLARAELRLVPGANHSLERPKRAQPAPGTAFDDIQDLIAAWIARLPGRD